LQENGFSSPRDSSGSVKASNATSPTSIKTFGDPQINALREEHSEEVQSLINGHSTALEALERQHAESIAALKAQLKESADLEGKSSHLEEIEAAHQAALASLHKDNDALIAELESSLSESEERRRQAKLKADQTLFELSRVQDEHQIQRSTDTRHIAELTANIEQLQNAKHNLESILDAHARDKKTLDAEKGSSRQVTSTIPPQGPPPSIPLPETPVKTARESSGSKRSGKSVDGHESSSDNWKGRFEEEKTRNDLLQRDLQDQRKNSE
jgi:hypothetical protein